MTLVEILVAAVILMIIALGSAAFVYQSRVGIAAQRNKRIALATANARLEEIFATRYDSIAGIIPQDYSLRYLRRNGAAWQASDTDPGETADINGKAMPVTTSVRYIDIDGGMSTYDCMHISVSVAYRPGLADRVCVQTIYAR